MVRLLTVRFDLTCLGFSAPSAIGTAGLGAGFQVSIRNALVPSLRLSSSIYLKDEPPIPFHISVSLADP